MRITEQILTQQSIAGLQNNLEQVAKLQESISTGQRINQPSDDPAGTSQVLGFNAVQDQLNQCLRNLTGLDGTLKVLNTTLDSALQVLSTVTQAAMGLTSGPMTAEQQATASSQVQSAFNQLLQIANSTYNGQYLFSGYQSNAPAYDNSGAYQGDGGVTSVDAGNGVAIASNLPGQQVFGSASVGVDIFGLLTTLQTAINTNDTATIQTSLATLNQATNQVAQAQAEVGVRDQTLQTQQTRLQGVSATVEQLKTQQLQADPNVVITQYMAQMNALNATREATAKLLQTSILNYL